ncbi:MAG: TatD family hydrolase [Actinobacteria bacterium]|nr:TatD family hydrolase [Actinomycetota bacterium]
MLDTHCHLTFDVFAGRVEQVVADAVHDGVRGMITISTTTSNCRDNLALTKLPEVWCSAGVHPLHSHEPIDWNELRETGKDSRCVAWGELGLDNHYDHPPRKVQDRVLEEQLAFLEGLRREGIDKPIVVHCRESFDDLIPVFRRTTFDPSRFVFHCFTGGPEEARRVLDFGAMISFTGVVTFRNAPEVAAAAKLVPADRLMVETDAPFLSPVPVRKAWPCEPRFVVHTAKFLAELRGVTYEEFEETVDGNAKRFFGLAPAHS